MRIVTYNIRGWRTLDDKPNLHALIATLQAIGGDVVGLNEVFYPRTVAADSLQRGDQRMEIGFVV